MEELNTVILPVANPQRFSSLRVKCYARRPVKLPVVAPLLPNRARDLPQGAGSLYLVDFSVHANSDGSSGGKDERARAGWGGGAEGRNRLGGGSGFGVCGLKCRV